MELGRPKELAYVFFPLVFELFLVVVEIVFLLRGIGPPFDLLHSSHVYVLLAVLLEPFLGDFRA